MTFFEYCIVSDVSESIMPIAFDEDYRGRRRRGNRRIQRISRVIQIESSRIACFVTKITDTPQRNDKFADGSRFVVAINATQCLSNMGKIVQTKFIIVLVMGIFFSTSRALAPEGTKTYVRLIVHSIL